MTEVFVQKRANTRLRIGVTEYDEKIYIDAREYYEDDIGEYKPTRKGFTVPLGLWEEFKEEISRLDVPEPEEQLETA